jgi:hypothetical protein
VTATPPLRTGTPPLKRKVRSGLALIVASALLAAAGTVSLVAYLRGGKADVPLAETSAGGAVPKGFKRVGSSGFSMAVPRAWNALPLTEDRLGKALDRTELDPALEKMIRSFGGNGWLFAYDPGDSSSNLDVLRRTASGTSPRRVMEQAQALLGTEVDATDIEAGIVSLPAGTAVRLTYVNHLEVDGRPVNIRQIQYHVFSGPYIYVLTFSGDGVDAQAAETMAGSIEIDSRSVTTA